jgi:hypothetical protein
MIGRGGLSRASPSIVCRILGDTEGALRGLRDRACPAKPDFRYCATSSAAHGRKLQLHRRPSVVPATFKVWLEHPKARQSKLTASSDSPDSSCMPRAYGN